MTGETDPLHPDPDDDAVRRLLADARHTAPMPAEVAARMDAVLADLTQSAPADSGGPAPAPSSTRRDPVVASLAAHRRRRAAGMLVAAAAIVVGGVVVAQNLPGPGGQSGASATAEDRGASTDSLGNTSGGSSSETPEPAPASPGDLAGAERAKVRNGRVVVRPQHFTSDAFAARRLLEKQARARSLRLDQVDGSCAVAPQHGKLVNATYERAPAVLVFRRPVSSTQVVDLFVCGSSRPVRSATLPSP